MPTHNQQAQKFKCEVVVVKKKKDGTEEKFVCGKVFISNSKLVDHQDVHLTAKLPCSFCKKLVAKRQRGVKEHERTCTKNPNREGEVPCRLCLKEFAKRSSMLRHFRSAHPGQDPDA